MKRKILLIFSAILLVVSLYKSIIGAINMYELKYPQTVSDYTEAKFWHGKVMQVEFYYAQYGYLGFGKWSDPIGSGLFSLRLTEKGYIWTTMPGGAATSEFYSGVDVYEDVEGIRKYGEEEKQTMLVKVRRAGRLKDNLYERSTLEKVPNAEDNTNYDYYVERIDPRTERSRIYGWFTATGLTAFFFWFCLIRYLEEKRVHAFWEKEKRKEKKIELIIAMDKERRKTEREKQCREISEKWEGEQL